MNNTFFSKKIIALTLSSFVVGGVFVHLTQAKLAQATAPAVVHACINSDGTLRLPRNNDTCRHNESAVDLATAGSSGNGYFGLPFISSYNDLTPLASKFAGQDFSNANLTSNTFRSGNFQGVIFKNANLFGVNFAGADFSHANFQGANLSNSVFNQGTNFTSADFTGATFGGVQFNTGTTTMDNANFTNANLGGVTNMGTGATVNGAIWSNTICPDNTNSDANGNTCVGHM